MIHYFDEAIEENELPKKFVSPFRNQPHPICLKAVKKLQHHLRTQQEWKHNFGLNPEDKTHPIGKMFGVLLVQNTKGKVGYLAAFSGKLANANFHTGFVPPIFDSLKEDGFLSVGLRKITLINGRIKELEATGNYDAKLEAARLKTDRKELSNHLQSLLFDAYFFLNKNLESKNVREIFEAPRFKNPPAGAGECAAPKLLQFAFQNHLKPLAMAEFWWGKSPKSENWIHGEFYPACKEKCEPILAHMLRGIEIA